ncbi:sensor histidine kinase [Paenibacillus eucommiae]|uniref:Sensor histidine kinase YesM n=1 Tax=Paenibacillus eucommiae TaxID=1355755 RepID=A0ABS4J3U8_9BACL|nr:sensor histidine kinase [Paenibacillus eucommiae]MBP1994517.1 sensor histidine kinase YesM [Paenibacillus eucommiae]
MFKSIAFQKKLFIHYSIVVTIIIAGSVAAFYQYMVKTTEETAMNNLKQVAVKTSEQLDSLFRSMDQIALQVIVNQRVIEMMGVIHEKQISSNYFEMNVRDSTELGRILLTINGPNIAAPRISVFNLQGDYMSLGVLEESAEQIQRHLRSKPLSALFAELNELKGKSKLLKPHSDYWSEGAEDEQQKLISIVRLIRNLSTGENYGMVEVQQYEHKVTDLLNLEHIGKVRALVFDDKGEVVASHTALDNQPAVKEPGHYFLSVDEGGVQSRTVINPETGKEEVMVGVNIAFSNLSLVLVQPRHDLFATKRTAVQILLFLGVSLVVVTLAIMFVMSKNLTRPLKQIRKSIHEVTLFNLSIELDPAGKENELILLNRTFAAMFKRLNESVNQEIKAHMLALQSQMNPHFLYNILSVISSTAEESGNDRIMNMCYKLSQMLRYVSTINEADITLKDEIAHTSNYLDLMKDRYEEYFSYVIEADEKAVAQVKVPKLILQPIVENCFQHAFTQTSPPWFIRISVHVDDDSRWTVEVSDNGTGFDQEALHALTNTINDTMVNLSNTEALKIGGLGLVNTIVRLKLLYREDFHYQITKNEPQGTLVRMGGRSRK